MIYIHTLDVDIYDAWEFQTSFQCLSIRYYHFYEWYLDRIEKLVAICRIDCGKFFVKLLEIGMNLLRSSSGALPENFLGGIQKIFRFYTQGFVFVVNSNGT